MKNSRFYVLFSFFISVNLLSTVVSAEGRWDRGDRTMMELDAEVDKMNGKPQVRVETKVIEKVIIKEVLVPVPQPVAAPVTQVVAQPQALPEPVPDDVVTVEADGYIFKLSNCALSHRNIKCQLNIISTDTDGKLTLYAGYGSDAYATKLFDTVGNEFKPSKIVMGNKSNARHITNTYISGVTVQGAVYFENVKSNTNEIALIELSFTNRVNRKYSRIKFRPVKLSL